VSDDELSFSIPLDSDGFVRRECPHCAREFKWRLAADEEESEPIPVEGYACPYCAGRAPADHWWTKAQLEHAQQLAASAIFGPELKKLERRADPRSLISLEVKVDVPRTPPPLTRGPGDIRRVDFECHPSEAIKVFEGWTDDVHCLICGATA
jgi:DNA-directed RNA polymerase subunit RPC12/RpoP